jgi:hypothetical protein
LLTCRPTRFLESTGVHPANAIPWFKSTPRNPDAYRALLMHTAGAPLNGPAQLTGIPFRAQPAAPTHHKQLSISILLPR